MSHTVFVSGLFHETHTFLSETTGLAQFREMALHHTQALTKYNRGNGTPVDGFLWYAEQQGWNVVPGIYMAAMPAGMVEEEAFRYFKTHFFAALEKTYESLDAVYLVLHGAMVSEGTADAEGNLLEELQQFLVGRGKNIPVVAVLDLHANVSQQMIDHSTCLYAYRKNPHTDAREAAIRTAELLNRLLERPGVQQIFHPTRYIIPPTGLSTSADPMRAILQWAAEIEAADPEVLCINVLGGFAYADIPDCGFSLTCCTYGSRPKAEAYLQELEHLLETHLGSAYPEENSLEEALALSDKRALEVLFESSGDVGAGIPAFSGKHAPVLLNEASDNTGGSAGIPALNGKHAPILLIEASDNIGGGTPGDGTGILAPLLLTGKKGIVAILNDGAAVQQCYQAGTGAAVDLLIGGKTDAFHGDPVPFRGRVKNLTDGRFELENKNSHLAAIAGTQINMGPCAVIENEQATVLLTTCKTPPMDLGQLRSQGIAPEAAQYIIVKAAVSHKQAYDPIAAASFYVDSPGLCTSRLTTLPYRHTGNKIIRP